MTCGMVFASASAGWATGAWATAMWQATKSFLDWLLVQVGLELSAQLFSATMLVLVELLPARLQVTIAGGLILCAWRLHLGQLWRLWLNQGLEVLLLFCLLPRFKASASAICACPALALWLGTGKRWQRRVAVRGALLL